MVLIGEHIDARIGAATTATDTTVRIAMTIHRTSGSATTDSGGITDTLTNRGGRNKAETYQHSDIAIAPKAGASGRNCPRHKLAQIRWLI
jgi:hypothetical protein